MQLQIDYLRTFIAVADTKGFTKAGKQVNRSQSTVSMQIKRLETEIGAPLFKRIGKTAELTSTGQTLIRYARRILKEHDDAILAISKPKLKGKIRFGSPEHYTIGVMPDLLARFANSFPDVLVEMRCENSDKIRELVDQNELDIGLYTQFDDTKAQVIYNDPVVWISKPGFVLQRGKPIPIAVFESDCIFRNWAIEALEKTKLPFRIVYVSRSISGILDAVRAGLAIAPVVKSNVPKDLQQVGIEEGLPLLPVSNIALHKANNRKSDTIDCFANHLIETFNDKA